MAANVAEQTRIAAPAGDAAFLTLSENLPDPVIRYDVHGRRTYLNPAAERILGGAAQLHQHPVQMAAHAGLRLYLQKLGEVLAHGRALTFECAVDWLQPGSPQHHQVRMAPEYGADGQLAGVLAIGRDFSDVHGYRQKIAHQAFFDALTGLPNRALLFERIARHEAGAGAGAPCFGLMLLDLDRFQEVNDTLGHGVGDDLLREAARRALACVADGDTVARLGGDEFAFLLPDTHCGAALATLAATVLARLAEPFVLDGRELVVTASIGIARYPADSDDVDTLYKYADAAMYHAKKMGRNNVQFYAKELTSRSLARMEAEAALRKAVQRGELELHYQPQIALASGRVVGAEALLRWNRPGHGLVGPDQFVALAEEAGLIVGIGEWVLACACRAAVGWNRDRREPFKVAVNVSTRQFVRNDLVGTVRRILAETGCRSAWLELEITESLLLDDSDEVAAMLTALHGMGVHIAIDDFGTGYSALSYLHRFPVRQLKIDRSFISGMLEQRDKHELVKVMLSIAAALGLESVAEGVETPGQAAFLKAYGCRLAQGYLFGTPMPLGAFAALLAGEESGR